MDHHTWRGTGANAGIWQWNAFDTVFQYNESYDGPDYNQDGCSYDSDYWSGGTVYQYNYSHDTPMGFMLLMCNNDTDIVRYNLSQNDGVAWRHIVYTQRSESYVYNNVFYYDGANWTFIHDNDENYDADLNIGNYFNYYNNIWYNTNKEKTSRWRVGNWENANTQNNMVYEASGIYGAKEIPGAIHADPKFVNAGGGATAEWSSLAAYKLQAGSPAIGAGAYVDVVPQGTGDYGPQWNWETGDYNTYQDFYGNALYNGAPDIGLEESSYEANPVDIEKNAVYKFYNRASDSYLQRAGETENLIPGTEEATGQDFMVVGEGNGCKIRIWDTATNNYLYLEAVSGQLALKETSQTVWKLEDMKNGLIQITADNNSVTGSKDAISLQAAGQEFQQWQLQLQEHSKAYNAGGKEIEGFSADQEFAEQEKQSGYVGSPTVIGSADTSSVYDSALTGKELEYRIYGEDGEYTLRLYFKELESVKDRTFTILVNGKPVKEDYRLSDGEQLIELGGIYPADGRIDVKLTSGYNADGQDTNPILCGISADRQPMSQVVSRMNAGGDDRDGLAADAAYTEKNGSGYYGASQTVGIPEELPLPSPDAGMGTVLKTAREGTGFGYKFKEAPGSYRVKLYFNEMTGTNHKFNVLINGEAVQENYVISDTAKGANKGTALVFETESKDGLVDIAFQGVDGAKAMVNAVIVESNTPITDENLALKEGVELTASSTAEDGNKALKNANDNDQATRWSTANGVQTGSITVNLQKKYMLSNVMVDWTPGAYATSYHIEISEDGANYKSVETISEANPGLNVTKLDSIVAQYVKIVGDSVNDQWGMSLTELGVYGTEVRGEMSATAAVTNKEEANLHELAIGAENIYKKFSTMKVKVIYDSSKFEFAGSEDAATENMNTDALKFVSRSDVNAEDPEQAYVEYVFSMKKKEAFQEPGDVCKTTIKTLTDAREYVKVEMRLTDAAGQETTLPMVKAYMPAGVTYEAIQALIAECQSLYDRAEVGIIPGTYKQEDKDILQAAIATAKGYTDKSTAEELKKAFADLDGAREAFLAAEKKAQYVNYHKDYRADRDEPNFSAGTASFTDEALKLAVGAHTSATDLDAPLLTQGHMYIKFKVDNVSDQTKFVVLGEDGTKRFSVGYDAGGKNWFWDSASQGYANFGVTQSLQADKETEVHIQYMCSKSGGYDVTLWVDGVQVGKTAAGLGYAQGPGRLTVEARNQAKNLQILETYFTDAEPVTIQVSTEGKGTASQTGAVTSFMEADKTIYFTPEDGEELQSVLVDGEDVTEEVKNNESSYTFTYLQDSHTVKATFTGGSETPDPDENQGLYHKDYRFDEADVYSESTAELENSHLNLNVLKTATTGNVVRAAVPAEAEAISEGILHTRFRVNNIEDQTVFDLKRAGDNDVIRIGFDYDPNAGRAMWFYDKAVGGGWGDIGDGILLETDKTCDLKAEFKIKEDYGNGTALYAITLTIDGTIIGTIEADYSTTPGTFGWGARRADKVYSIDEVYYTNQTAHTLTVNADETNGTVSETGILTTYHGASKTFSIVPEEGYQAKVTVNEGAPVLITNNLYTLDNIQGDTTVAVNFEALPTPVTYHKDFTVGDTAVYAGNLFEGQEIKDGQTVLKLQDGTKNNFAVAMDTQAPDLDNGTFYTRFAVGGIEDQVLFDLMTDGISDGSVKGYIRIGYDSADGGSWFYDKTSSGDGWGPFPVQTVKLEPDKEYELELQFAKKSEGKYDLILIVNGISCGTVENINYGPDGGKYAFASRESGKEISVKEVYYTNQPKRTITVTAGEHGTVSQTGTVTTFEGMSKTLTFMPDTGYQAASVTVNGQPVEKVDSYTFQNISADASLEVTFEITAAGTIREELGKDIAAAKETVNDNYTTESWNTLQTAIADAQKLLDEGSVDETALTHAKEAITTAIGNLAKAELDKRELQKLYSFGDENIDKQQEADRAKYTQESFTAYTEKKNAAAVLLDIPVEVINAETQLSAAGPAPEDAVNPAEEGLEPAEQPAEVMQAAAEADQDLDVFTDNVEGENPTMANEEADAAEDLFTAEAFSGQEEPIGENQENQADFMPEEDIFTDETAAEEISEEIMLQADAVTQDIIDTALADMEQAIRNLKPADPDNMSEVEKAVFTLEVNAYALKGKVQEKYSEERWNEFEVALTTAEELVKELEDNPSEVSEEKIAAAQDELAQAAEDLPKPAEPTARDDLQKLYDDNVSKPNNNYTSATWEAFQAALANAYTVLGTPDAAPEAINEALTRLQNTIDNLTVSAPDPQPTPEPTPTPTPEPSPTPTPEPEAAFQAATPEVTVKATNLYTVSINWKAIDNAGSYRVYRKGTQAGEKYAALKTVGKDITSYVDKTAKPGTTYYYAVRAFWDEGGKGIKSKISADMKVTAPKLATPKPKAVVVNTNQVKVTWNKVEGATTYKVWRKETNSKQGYQAVGTIKASQTASFVDKKVKYGTQYTYHVRAYRTTKGYSVKSAYTDKLTAAIKVTLPAPKVTAQGKSKSSIQVKWNKLSGATGYAVYRKTGKNGAWGRIYTANSKTLTYVDKKAKKGTQYYYMVRGYKKVNGKNIYGTYSKGAAAKTK